MTENVETLHTHTHTHTHTGNLKTEKIKVKVKFKKNEGITLLALVVTIIVLLILSTITINMLTGENGIIKNTEKAKEATEIADEKEIVQRATVNAIGKNKYGDLEKEKLEKELSEKNVEVIENGETLVVKFIESERYYEVGADGNVSDSKQIEKDEYAGDITKGGKCGGSESLPFEINCIEDLVVLSKISNGTSSELGFEKSNFNGKHIILKRDLDFESIFSYSDYTSTKYGDLNEDGNIENVMTELTKKNDECIGFTPIGLVGLQWHI